MACTRVRGAYDELVDGEACGRKRRRLLTKLRNDGFIECRGSGKGAEYRHLELE